MFTPQQQEQNAAALKMDMQREEVMAIVREYWKPVLGVAIFLIALTIGIQIYRAVEQGRATEQTAMMVPLIEAAATAENAKAFEDFANNHASGDRRALAKLYASARYQFIGDDANAKRLMAEVAKDADSVLEDYASLMLANGNAGDAKALLDKKSPWYPAALELSALAETDKAKRRDLYGEILNTKDAPQGMRQRAVEFSGQAMDGE